MKLFRCDGRVLEVRDVGPAIYAMRAVGVPLKPCGWFLIDEDKEPDRLRELRDRLRELRDSGLYEKIVDE